jgi:hypothetical protein
LMQSYNLMSRVRVDVVRFDAVQILSHAGSAA